MGTKAVAFLAKGRHSRERLGTPQTFGEGAVAPNYNFFELEVGARG